MTINNQRISPFFWFDDQAEQAVALYTSIFPNSSVGTPMPCWISRVDTVFASSRSPTDARHF